MGIHTVTKLLELAPAYKQMAKSLRHATTLTRTQVIDEAVPFLLATLWKDLQVPILVICPSSEQSRTLEENISGWVETKDSVLRFGESDTLPFERLVTDSETSQQRIHTLFQLTKKDNSPPIVIA